jgi:RNA polymerase sigma factor (sigma-70 family)
MAVDDRAPGTVRMGQRSDRVHPDRGERIAALVGAARQGSEVARAAGLSAGDAEDVVQTVWMRLIAHLDDIHTSAALTGWLVVTARREAWRVRAEGRKHFPADTESFEALPAREPGSEEQVIIDDQRRTLWRAISQLTGRCQELLRIIAFVPRPDYAAVAAELGMPIGSIGPTRGRCLAKLRVLLASTLEGDDVVG